MKIVKAIRWLIIYASCTSHLVSAESLFVSDDTRQQLGAAQAFYEQAKYVDGLQTLSDLLKQRRLSDYERALAYQLQGYLYAANNDLPRAATAFENSLRFDALEESLSLNLHFNLAQILVAMEQYQKAIPQLETWLHKTREVKPQQRLLLATTYYFAKQYALAEKHIELTLSNVIAPQKSSYELALAIYLENKKYDKAINILYKALSQYADDANFWRQLANIYRQTDQQSLAVASLQTLYDIKELKQDEIVNLAKMLFYLDAPFAAAHLLQEAISEQYLDNNAENLQLLAECWLAAREYQSAADNFANSARLTNNGDLFLRQAEILIEREQWNDSISALHKAFATEKLSDEGRAWLLLGIANYEAGNFVAAKEAFSLAVRNSSHEKSAQQWLLLVESQI